MIQVEFTEQRIEELKYERYHHPHPRVQQKMEVLYLKSQGLAHQDIRRVCNISKTTLTVYLRQYLAGGIERLKQLDYQGQPSALNAHIASVGVRPQFDVLRSHRKAILVELIPELIPSR